jgi:hypothetical protein
VQEQFAEKFPEKTVPHRDAFHRLIEKFRATGSVLDDERSGKQTRRKCLLIKLNGFRPV